ncbi:MAG: hypothetical protein JXX14_25205, partial [Deltaproteobacteria bacterium]|nr:hypothetical protein [Deltaproteobacteria bacterium]
MTEKFQHPPTPPDKGEFCTVSPSTREAGAKGEKLSFPRRPHDSTQVLLDFLGAPSLPRRPQDSTQVLLDF